MSKSQYYVLYLEDDFKHMAQDITLLQQKLPIRLALAASVAKAKGMMDTYDFDLFILDIEIAGERNSGIQLAEYIRQQPRYAAVPIVFTSMHTHYSHWLFSSIHNCSFLPKPFTEDAILTEIGAALGIAPYINRRYVPVPLLIPYHRDAYIEVPATAVSYIEVVNRCLAVQYIDGEALQFKNASGMFKSILEQLEEHHISCLRQIYRSIIINVNQIKDIQTDKSTAYVQLFHEPRPFPLSTIYRDNLREFL